MPYLNILTQTYQVFKTHHITSFPFDCRLLMMSSGYTLIPYSQLETSAPDLYELCRQFTRDAFKLDEHVMYNDQSADYRIKFSLMHELGHDLLGHHGESLADEDEADLFASCILAPRVMIGAYKCLDAEDVHRIFGISYAAANRAWVDHCKCRRYPWSYEDSLIFKWFTAPKTIPTTAKSFKNKTVRPKTPEETKPHDKPTSDLKDYPIAARYRQQLRRECREIQKKLKEYEQFADKNQSTEYLRDHQIP